MSLRSNLALRFVSALVLLGSAGAAVAAAPAPVAAVSAPAAHLPLTVLDGALAKAVEKRQPIDVGTSFEAGSGGLYAWVKVKNPGADTTITMVWKKDGATKLRASLPVGHSYVGWKTWSKRNIGKKDAGAWTVDVLDADGNTLQTLAFTVGGAGSDVSLK